MMKTLAWAVRWGAWWNERDQQNDWSRYVWRQRIRIQLLARELKTTSTNLLSKPDQRRCLEQLRHKLEGLGYLPRATNAVLDDEAQQLMEDARQTGATTRTQLSRANGSFYNKITAHSQKESIFAQLRMRRSYHNLTNDEIIASCKDYTSLSDLHMRKPTLYREVRARGLRERVVAAHKWFTYPYIDRHQQQYRSRLELVFANLLSANGIRFTYDGLIPGHEIGHGDRWRYDFHLTGADLYVELLQTENAGPASGDTRRQRYVENTQYKRTLYKSAQLLVCWISTEEYASHDRERQFAELCASRLRDELERSLTIPPQQELCFNAAHLHLMEMSAHDILSDQLKDCRGIADFQNRHSSLRHALQPHPELEVIMRELRRRGKEQNTTALTERWEQRRKHYMSYTEARHFVRGIRLKGQTEFQRWAHHGIANVPPVPANFPRDPYHVYRRLGTWVSWTDFLGIK